MKRSILMLLVIGVASVFSGCSKEDSSAPEFLNDQETTSLKAAKVKTPFTGRCDFVADGTPGKITELPNGKTKMQGFTSHWYDLADDWRVTGKTTWYANYYWEGVPFASNAKVFGKAELFVDDPEDPNAPPCGKWDITWHGYMTDGGLKASVDAVGTGKEGEVKGLVAKWTYTLDIPAHGLMYETEGTIH